jgi:hypothetical protein
MQNRFGDELDSEDDIGPVEDEIAPISQDESVGQEPDVGALSAPRSARLRVQRRSRKAKPLDSPKRRRTSPLLTQNAKKRTLPDKNKSCAISKDDTHDVMPPQSEPEKVVINIASETGDKEPQRREVCDVDGMHIVIQGAVSRVGWLATVIKSNNDDLNLVQKQFRPGFSLWMRSETDDKTRECTANFVANGVRFNICGPLKLIGWLGQKVGWIIPYMDCG